MMKICGVNMPWDYRPCDYRPYEARTDETGELRSFSIRSPDSLNTNSPIHLQWVGADEQY